MPEMTPLGNTGAGPFESINNILGIKQKQQALQLQAQQLQTGQYTQQTEQATAQAAQRTQGEQARLSSIPWHSFENDDGSLDIDKATKAALAVAPTTGPDFVKRLADMSKGAADSKSAFNSLNEGLQNKARNVFGVWSGDNKASVGQLETQAKLLVDNTPDSSRPAMEKIVNHALQAIKGESLIAGGPKSAQEQKQAALAFSRAGLSQEQVSGTGGLSTPEPVSVNTGKETQFGTLNRGTGAVTMGQSGAPVTNQIPPGYTLVNNQLVRTDSSGISAAPVIGGGEAPPQAPPNKLQPTPRPGINPAPGDNERYQTLMKSNQEHVTQVSGAANDIQNGVGATRYRNAQIKDTLSQAVANHQPNLTGPGADALHWAASHLPGATKFASDYDTVNHYLAQNSAAIAKTMGVPGTNAGAETAAAAAGSTHQTPGALLEVTKVNDAMNTGLDYYNRGLAKATNNGADMSKVAAYRQAFGQAFDVNAMRYEDAKRAGDREEMDKLAKGPRGKELAQRLRVLRSLSATGDLP